MYRILYLLTVLLLSYSVNAQVYSNISDPYSDRIGFNFNIDEITYLNITPPDSSINKINQEKDAFATNINTNLDLLKEAKTYNLPNNKVLCLVRLKIENAKSLNFSFENFYLGQNDALYIYTKDKKQIMGPITNINNNKVFNTHLLLTEEVIFELVKSKDSNPIITISKIGYGIRNNDYILNKVKDFDTEINELTTNTKNAKIQNNCSSYTQNDFKNDINNMKTECQSVAHHNYGNTGMKEANCVGFENFEKNKRAATIVITYNCTDENWLLHSGILINTAKDLNSSNYCKSYVLTCGHCIAVNNTINPSVEPQYYAIRFNWIRNVCDLNTLPNCQSNSQPWIDAINMNDVIDYTDVSLVSYQQGDSEFALLEINTPLRHKEYYNGWRIPEKLGIAYDIESHALGSSGSSPFVMREQITVRSTQYIDNYDYLPLGSNTGLISGYSGTSVLDDNGYYLGFAKSGMQGISIGMLYFNYPWNSLTVKPRDILDENEILLSDFNNKLEIKVEGEERWEKGDCFESAYGCSETFNIEDFINPATNIDGLCCFKLDFIDPNANFTGGKPYGLRVYRNTDRQETLFHTFGTPVFPDDEENYNDPQNGYLVDFCIDADKLDDDNNTIIFEFLDNNGNIMCRREVEIFCTEPCEESCSEEFENWLTITADENGCAEDECLITLDLEIPEESACYTHFSIETTLGGNPLPLPMGVPPGKLNASLFDLSIYSKCIKKGKDFEVTIKLYKGIEDTEPCVIKKSIYCDLEDENPPCVPDCALVPWVKQPDLQVAMIGCPGCAMNISYYSRKGCGKSDIQITSIEKHNTNPNNPNACNLCDEVDTYREALQAIISHNQMGFILPETDQDPCLTTFRVSKSSCWATWDLSSYGPNEELLWKWVLTKPCNSDCCLRELKICKLANGDYTIEDIGSVTNIPSCNNQGGLSTSNGNIPCHYTCDYLDNINTSFKAISSSRINIFDEINESIKHSSNLFVMINVSNDNQYLNINVEETTGQIITIKLFSIRGELVNELVSTLNPNFNNFNMGLDKLLSGSYLYAIDIDGIIVKSDNIILVK